ncbi:MAG: hypothetical protein UX36_C0006G0012 [Microgenomates group bacterium GW2011_GWC1_46_15]|nr:MAG: hypothetical protein UX36_C0006G0012 [Microgenomates group bacterium GW2011_GWC1_46_15]
MNAPVKPQDEVSKIISQIERSSTEQLRITSRTFNGKKYFDARIWLKSTGDFYPTKKGISLPVDILPQFIGELCTLAEVEGVAVVTKP